MPVPFTLSFQPLQAQPSCCRYLQRMLVSAHAIQVEQWLTEGLIRLNAEMIRCDQPCAAGDRLVIGIPGHREEAVNTEWRLVWENDELMAVDKPALLPVSRTTRNLYLTLISLVRRQTPHTTAQLLHRLDTETSGLILLAKNTEADRKWKPRLKALMKRKLYHAWVQGTPPWQDYAMECRLSEKRGSLIRSQVYVVDEEQPQHYPKPKLSQTYFRVLERQDAQSLIECELVTGRKHQIRAQLAFLGHPIVGDKIYAFSGKFYLKRLQQALTHQDLLQLGASHQRLSAVGLELDLGSETIFIRTATADRGES